MRHARGLRLLGFFVLCLSFAGCGHQGAGTSTSRESRRPVARGRSAEELRESIRPELRDVPGADVSKLWEAMRGYVERGWQVEALDAERWMVETKTVEWTHEGIPRRTRVFARILQSPERPEEVQTLVVAYRIESQMDFEHAEDGKPLATNWQVMGHDPDIQRLVSDQIHHRYLALRAGKDPDQEPLRDVPPGLRRPASGP